MFIKPGTHFLVAGGKTLRGGQTRLDDLDRLVLGDSCPEIDRVGTGLELDVTG
jgi:hypothetical protein